MHITLSRTIITGLWQVPTHRIGKPDRLAQEVSYGT